MWCDISSVPQSFTNKSKAGKKAAEIPGASGGVHRLASFLYLMVRTKCPRKDIYIIYDSFGLVKIFI